MLEVRGCEWRVCIWSLYMRKIIERDPFKPEFRLFVRELLHDLGCPAPRNRWYSVPEPVLGGSDLEKGENVQKQRNAESRDWSRFRRFRSRSRTGRRSGSVDRRGRVSVGRRLWHRSGFNRQVWWYFKSRNLQNKPHLTLRMSIGWSPGTDQAAEMRDLFERLGCRKSFLDAKPSRRDPMSKDCEDILYSISFFAFEG